MYKLILYSYTGNVSLKSKIMKILLVFIIFCLWQQNSPAVNRNQSLSNK